MYIAPEDIEKATQQAKALALLPMLKRFDYAAFISTEEKYGVGKINNNTKHVDYWLTVEFNPFEAVQKIESIR
jgi:hypothetical protein